MGASFSKALRGVAGVLRHLGDLAANALRGGVTPVSVNWHITRSCNYKCKFCFHTMKNSFFLPRDEPGMVEAKRCLRLLKEAGMEKLNFSGGEPFLHAKELGELCRFLKRDLKVAVSIVSNGSKITKEWLQDFGQFVNILAISCDSFDAETNERIGRGEKFDHLGHMRQIREWCREHKVKFKLNSVITSENVGHDMVEAVRELDPCRWKVFQCLLIEGENVGEGALREAQGLVITEEQFKDFVERHSSLECLVPEDNEKMMNSYLILDEELRFLNCTAGGKKPSRSIREVPVAEALKEAGFDQTMFHRRGGVYDWTPKPAQSTSTVTDVEDLASPASLSTADTDATPQSAGGGPASPTGQSAAARLGLGAYGAVALTAAGGAVLLGMHLMRARAPLVRAR